MNVVVKAFVFESYIRLPRSNCILRIRMYSLRVFGFCIPAQKVPRRRGLCCETCSGGLDPLFVVSEEASARSPLAIPADHPPIRASHLQGSETPNTSPAPSALPPHQLHVCSRRCKRDQTWVSESREKAGCV